MAISDAQFALWLDQDSARRRCLYEIDYRFQAESFVDPDTIYTPTTGTLYVADAPYIDGAAGVVYADRVRGEPNFKREIDRKTLTGKTSVSVGSLELVNTDGGIDFLHDLAVDGSQVRCYLGDADWDRSDFRLMFVALAERVTGDERRVVISLRDGSALLNATVSGDAIGGTGPNLERIQPINYGYCNNVECLQIDAAGLVYRYGADGDVRLATVRDAGLSVSDQLTYTGDDGTLIFNASTDTLDMTDHGFIDEDILHISGATTYPAGLPEGYYFVRNKTSSTLQLSATRTGSVAAITSGSFTGTMTIKRINYVDHQDGTFTLAHPPFGIVTCDVLTLVSLGDDRSAYYASDVIQALVRDHAPSVTRAGLCTPDHFTVGDQTTFDETDHDFLIGVRITEERNLLDVLDSVAFTGLMFYGFNRDGEFVYGRIDPTVTATSDMDFTADDLRAEVKLDRADPGYYSYNFVYNKNWHVQSEFLGAVTAEDIAKYSARGRYGSGLQQGIVPGDPPISDPYANIPEEYHLTMTEGAEIETLLSAIVDADAYNQGTEWFRKRRAIFFPYLEFVSITVGMRAWTLDLGSVAQLTMPRFGFDAGVKGQVVSITLRPSSGLVDLVLCRRRVCDVSEDLHLA